MDAVAVTDHGNLFGAVEFYNAAKKEGIKPILGLEAYVAPELEGRPSDRRNREHSGTADGGFHLVLLAENQTGWSNLRKLSSDSFLEGFYYKPRMDNSTLTRWSDGLIAINGAPGLVDRVPPRAVPAQRAAGTEALGRGGEGSPVAPGRLRAQPEGRAALLPGTPEARGEAAARHQPAHGEARRGAEHPAGLRQRRTFFNCGRLGCSRHAVLHLDGQGQGRRVADALRPRPVRQEPAGDVGGLRRGPPRGDPQHAPHRRPLQRGHRLSRPTTPRSCASTPTSPACRPIRKARCR